MKTKIQRPTMCRVVEYTDNEGRARVGIVQFFDEDGHAKTGEARINVHVISYEERYPNIEAAKAEAPRPSGMTLVCGVAHAFDGSPNTWRYPLREERMIEVDGTLPGA